VGDYAGRSEQRAFLGVSMGQMISSGAADPSDARARFPIRWSEAALRTLHEEYEQVRHDTAEPRAALLSAQLKAAAGMFAEAESIVCDVLRADATRASAADNLKEVLWTLFVVQRFDLVCALLRQNASLTEHIEIIMEERNEDEFWQIEWQILSSTRAHFIFNKSIFKNDPAKMLFVRFVQIFPLFAQYMRRQPTETGSVTISLGDADLLDGLGFCTRLTQAFLIPDYFFIADRGYDALRGFFSEKAIPWGDRHPVALWRGGSTGDPNLPSHRWRELPRMRLC